MASTVIRKDQTMSDMTRNLMLEVADGNMKCLPLLHHIYKLGKRDECLRWLLKNNIKGSRLDEFFKDQGRSILQTLAYLIQMVEKLENKRTLNFGDDYV